MPDGLLVLAGTPLGRPDDASARLRTLLAEADVVAAEDTRRVRRLAADLGVTITGRVVSYFEGNERQRGESLVGELLDGATVLVVTDAGMPSVSDPGYRLVAAAVEAGVRVTTAPGPSAVLAALAVSGLPVDRFCFEGFLPRKPGERARACAALAAEPRTMVFFESPHRTVATLAALAEALGEDRPAAVCRELTKTHEEVRRDGLADLHAWARDLEHGVRGEVTIVVAGASRERAEPGPDELARLVEVERQAGRSTRDAVDAVAASTGVARRRVYDAAHGARSGPTS